MNRFNEPIDDEFEKSLVFLNQGKLIFDKSFKQALFEFFDKHYNDPFQIHDALFNNFSLFWTQSGNILLGEQVYRKILPFIHEWENTHQPHLIHKGTPYYFYAVFCILKGDIEKGLLLMHQAYLEDQRLGRNDTPSSFFIKLDDKRQDQFFRQKVLETAVFLESLLTNYRNTPNATLTMDDLRNKFLGVSQHEEESFFFVYCIFKFEKIIKEIEVQTRSNRMASHIETALIFELCKLTEALLTKQIGPNQSNWKLPTRIEHFCQDARVNLNLVRNNLGFLNAERDRDFENTIKDLMNHTYNDPRFVRNPTPIEFDIALTYCLRNFGGHKIQDQKTIYEEFEKIVHAILNSIFYIIEKVY